MPMDGKGSSQGSLSSTAVGGDSSSTGADSRSTRTRSTHARLLGDPERQVQSCFLLGLGETRRTFLSEGNVGDSILSVLFFVVEMAAPLPHATMIGTVTRRVMCSPISCSARKTKSTSLSKQNIVGLTPSVPFLFETAVTIPHSDT